jgi:hypothetical protein
VGGGDNLKPVLDEGSGDVRELRFEGGPKP